MKAVIINSSTELWIELHLDVPFDTETKTQVREVDGVDLMEGKNRYKRNIKIGKLFDTEKVKTDILDLLQSLGFDTLDLEQNS